VQHCCMRRISKNPRDDISPSYSPDGSQIAFMSNRIGQPHIYVMPDEGGDPVLISPYVYGEPGYYTSPDWSPVGNRIAFHGRSKGEFQIMTADASHPGSDVQQITSSGRNEDPSWAPDGRHLVFTGVREGGSGLYVMDTETGRLRPLVLGGRYTIADWSPLLNPNPEVR
jgi:TolB protein